MHSDQETKIDDVPMAVMVVDTKSFSKNDDATQHHMQGHIVDVLERAFANAGLNEVWNSTFFQDGTGDGYLFGFSPQHLFHVVDGVLDSLQLTLLQDAADGTDMRMRAALNIGGVPLHTHPKLDSPVGKTMIDACRLVDSGPARDLLEYSDPSVTKLSVLATESVMDWTVRRRNGWHRESEYVPVDVAIGDKGFEARAYAHVPAPSGSLLAIGVSGVHAQGEAKRAKEEAAEAATDESPDGGAKPAAQSAGRDVQDNTVQMGDVSGGTLGMVGNFHNGRDVARDITKSTTVYHGDAKTENTEYHVGRDLNRPQGDVNNGRDSGRRFWRGIGASREES